ncbi:MAG: DNA adenine methylase [Planctomycetota bacterium]|jgi:DNA adenine methylase
MGSKQGLLPFIMRHVNSVSFETALDAFSGSGCVGYALKKAGKRVFANDHHRFAYHFACATVENNATRLDSSDIRLLLRKNPRAGSFVREKYAGLYFGPEDSEFIDNTYANIQKLKGRLKKSLALAALVRACMKKRPRGIFTFIGKKSWDGRRDLNLTLRSQFIDAVRQFNRAVFSNHRRNKATCLDVFETDPKGIDLVYIDTPYITPHSDCDYTRRYHFVEGLCSYWHAAEIQEETLTKKMRSYPTAFRSASTASEALLRLFDHFKQAKIVVSYGSNGIPSRNNMVRLLKNFKKNVTVKEESHKYCFGNHGHKVGNPHNEVQEYLFIAT